MDNLKTIEGKVRAVLEQDTDIIQTESIIDIGKYEYFGKDLTIELCFSA